MRVVTRVESSGRGEDRVVVEHADGRTLVVVADGAGGTGDGAAAADMTCSMVVAAFRRGTMSADAWIAALSAIDRKLFAAGRGGQSTVVVVEIDGNEIRGASVGDSECWALDSFGFVDLTSLQKRKPLLGTGEAAPKGIGPTTLSPRLLVATDGLLKYCPRAEIDRLASGGTLEEAIDALVSKVRLRSGTFQADVAIALCDAGAAGYHGVAADDQAPSLRSVGCLTGDWDER